MTERTPRAAEPAIIASPGQYAAVAVIRGMRGNLPVYLALAVAIAMPSVAFLFRSLIMAQGARFGGAQTGQEFGTGADMIAAIAALVGLLQISLILNRALVQRWHEHDLLEAIVMRPGEIVQLTLWESTAHAAIGWTAGSMITVAAVWLGGLLSDIPWPLGEEWVRMLALGLVLSLLAVLLPSLSNLVRRFRSRSAMLVMG